MFPKNKTFLSIVSFLIMVIVGINGSCRRPEDCDDCNTEVREIEITRRMSLSYNGSPREANCIATININECDGVCLSKVAPSAVRYPGFDKDCRCCRDGDVRTREITLESCYDGAELLSGLTPTTHIKEPINCSCQSCRN